MNAPVMISPKTRVSPFGPKQSTDADRRIGLRIAALRKVAGLSQTMLGSQLGVTFQQIQKYERGHNRVGAARLETIARIFAVPVSTFFEDDGEAGTNGMLDFLTIDGAAELLRTYVGIGSETLRLDLLQRARATARLDAGDEISLRERA